MPVLLVAMLLRTIWCGVEFDTPYLTTYGGPLNSTTVVPLAIYNLYADQHEFGQASALALCVGALLLVGSILYLRSYRRTEASETGF
jgi:multiple sugar transport system permease protein